MKVHHFILCLLATTWVACAGNAPTNDTPEPLPYDTTAVNPDIDSSYHTVTLHSVVQGVQPMTGLVLWPEQAASRNASYGKSIALEYSYCLPCKVVKGKQNGQIQYDWTSFDQLLNQIAGRGHQAVVRFRYEYPGSSDVNGTRGATAVPDYIKAMDGYSETYSKNPNSDGPTYYADWRSEELQWFTTQFYTDLAARYGNDARIAFIEVGFGHWSEYHIYGTQLKLGVNFPSHEYQAEFLRHMAAVMPIPWAVSIDAADDANTPVVNTPNLLNLTFGLFDDSFMHKQHDLGSGDGYNEECWNAMGKTRWQKGVCGGEISYYTDNDQKNFLNPAGMYGKTWEQASAKYHITFMISNDAPGSTYGTAARMKEASMACGYRFAVLDFKTNGQQSKVLLTNTGIAPIYRDAFVAINNVRSTESLRGLLPNAKIWVTVPANGDGAPLTIVSDFVPTGQTIEYDADVK